MVTRFGTQAAQALKTILADLRASPTAYELMNLPTIRLTSDDNLNISLSDGLILSASANHLNNPINSSGRVDWSAVTRLKIDFIGAAK